MQTPQQQAVAQSTDSRLCNTAAADPEPVWPQRQPDQAVRAEPGCTVHQFMQQQQVLVSLCDFCNSIVYAPARVAYSS
ncbi:hypothetical protein DPMN_175039 [Dreissena polymorpha]|uniref:Uncharacterized protein n=1 Tax=Dreissena polymorpha TaxID=45954 RepID=A0A9D4E5Q7_DREPO|nr:hypothetical protein DPMN_175039 [Dreissena polymorpha]